LGAQDVAVHTRRDQVTIMSERLTHILYRSNMSYGQLIKYIHEMKEMGMIEEMNGSFRSFQITTKGKLFRDMITKRKIT